MCGTTAVVIDYKAVKASLKADMLKAKAFALPSDGGYVEKIDRDEQGWRVTGREGKLGQHASFIIYDNGMVSEPHSRVLHDPCYYEDNEKRMSSFSKAVYESRQEVFEHFSKELPAAHRPLQEEDDFQLI